MSRRSRCLAVDVETELAVEVEVVEVVVAVVAVGGGAGGGAGGGGGSEGGVDGEEVCLIVEGVGASLSMDGPSRLSLLSSSPRLPRQA